MSQARVERIPPQNLEAEVSVLGAILQDEQAAREVATLLRPGDFYKERHGQVFSAVLALLGRNQPLDAVTVGEVLLERGLPPTDVAPYLGELLDAVPTAANVKHHAAIVKRAAARRQLIASGAELVRRAYADGEDPGGILADFWEQVRPIEPATQPGAILLRLADVQAEAVRWVWPGRIPRGKLAMVVGDPGLGKSFMTLDFAARISRGALWPDGEKAERGDVVLLSAEDGVADTIRQRLDGLDGDPARIHVLVGVGNPEKPASFNLAQDLTHLEDAVLKTRARLVVIDPLSAYLGGVDSHKDADVRAILAPLAAMAERAGVAVVCVVHLNKSQQRQAIYRAQGSLAFVAAARAVFGVAEDQDDPARRVLVPLKMNLAPKPPGLAFRIVNGSLVWDEGTVSMDADTALGGVEARAERSERDEAKEFLREVLGDGPVRVEEVKKQAKAAGISDMTLRRARAELALRHFKIGFPGMWMWALPENLLTGEHVDHPDQDRARSGDVSKIEVAHPAELAHDPAHPSPRVSKIEEEASQQQLTHTLSPKCTNLLTSEYARAREDGEQGERGERASVEPDSGTPEGQGVPFL